MVNKPSISLRRSSLIVTGIVLGAVTAAAFAATGDEERIAAVRTTINENKACRGIGDFYWEIGDAQGPRASGTVGRRFSADKVVHIASASKWVFGAYVVERQADQIQAGSDILRKLEMQSGYSTFRNGACMFARTVGDCLDARNNGNVDASTVGKFKYNGGHDQKLAVDLGLGGLDRQQFGKELRRLLGDEIAIDVGAPQPAGGLEMSPQAYATFLRKILGGGLRMHDYLGKFPVCTLPRACPAAVESPVPVAWHYSLNHWVEDDANGDGAFSSPGAFGFYPWISADRQWYGLLARQSIERQASVGSVLCGIPIRKAWMSAQAVRD